MFFSSVPIQIQDKAQLSFWGLAIVRRNSLSVLDASDAKCLCGCRHGNKRDTNVILVARDGHVEDGLLDPVAHLEPCFLGEEPIVDGNKASAQPHAVDALSPHRTRRLLGKDYLGQSRCGNYSVIRIVPGRPTA
jgi:hypothetical protein